VEGIFLERSNSMKNIGFKRGSKKMKKRHHKF